MYNLLLFRYFVTEFLEISRLRLRELAQKKFLKNYSKNALKSVFHDKEQSLFYLIIGLIFLAVNAFFYAQSGAVLVTDSMRYLHSAEQISIGNFYQKDEFWYYAYCLFLSIFLKLKLGHSVIVFAQIIISLVATLLLFRASQNFGFSKKIAFVSVLVYLLFFDLWRWNCYILTESLYASGVAIFVFFLSRLEQKRNMYNYAYCILLAICIFWIRPNGISLIFSFLMYTFFKETYFIRNNVLKYVSICIVVLIGFLVLNKMLGSYQLVENYQRGETIYNFSTIPTYRGHEFALLEIPNNLNIKAEGTTLEKAFWFYIQNPVFGIKLFSFKVFWFLTHTKPYYSVAHNLWCLLMLLPLYFGLIFHIIKSKNSPLNLFLILYFLSNLLIIGFSCEDWDGRFIVGILPFLFVFGLSIFMRKVSENQK
jgi:hypothetical protein